MRPFMYDCYIEMQETEWRYVHTHPKVDVEGHDGEVHEYKCTSCRRATMYVTPSKLKEIIDSHGKRNERTRR